MYSTIAPENPQQQSSLNKQQAMQGTEYKDFGKCVYGLPEVLIFWGLYGDSRQRDGVKRNRAEHGFKCSRDTYLIPILIGNYNIIMSLFFSI